MARVLVLLLILPPLLMPPGMCICQFTPVANASPVSTIPAERRSAASHTQSPKKDCACDSCRSRGAVAGHDNELPPREPVRGPTEHWPGCPAAADSLPLSLVLPTLTLEADFTFASEFVTATGEVANPVARILPLPPQTASPPLFISHCSLLI